MFNVSCNSISVINNISVISWMSVLLVEETEIPRENHQLAGSHRQVCLVMSGNIYLTSSCDRHRLHISPYKSNSHTITVIRVLPSGYNIYFYQFFHLMLMFLKDKDLFDISSLRLSDILTTTKKRKKFQCMYYQMVFNCKK